MLALQNKQKTPKTISPFVTGYRLSVPCLKNTLISELAFNRKSASTKRDL